LNSPLFSGNDPNLSTFTLRQRNAALRNRSSRLPTAQ